MRSRGPKWPLFILALIFFLSGCTATNTGLKRNPSAKLEPAHPADEIAAFATENATGSRSIGVSPYGGGTATLGETYFSALGVPCRRVTFRAYSGKHHNLAVCDEAGGGSWTTAPDIFGDPNN